MVDLYFWRQLFVLSAALLYSIVCGFMLGYPAILTAAIVSSNTTDISTTKDQASWITASNGIAGILGSFILSPVLQLFGRKMAHIFLNSTMLIGWIIFSFTKSITGLYAARMIQGLSVGGIYINTIILSEYLHPKRRGYGITLKKTMIAVGILWCHSMELFLAWRQVAKVAAVINVLSIILTLFWPESPSFLALKGRFSECEKSYLWLNGDTTENRKHLKKLIETQSISNEINKKKSCSQRFFEDFRKKGVLKSLFIVSMLTLAIDLCGRYYFVANVIEIMKLLLGDTSSVSYFTIGADVMTLVALTSTTIVINCVNRRTLLYSSGILSAGLMLIISLLVHLNRVYKLSTEFLWLTATVIILQYFISNIGIIPVSFTLIGEIFPLESKGIGACVSGVVFTSFYTLTLKLTPVLMNLTGLTGTYAIYGFVLAICLITICKVLPETKDKTLLEIESEMKGDSKMIDENVTLI